LDQLNRATAKWQFKLCASRIPVFGNLIGNGGTGGFHGWRGCSEVRRDPTMTLNWIARRFNMGAAGSLANLLSDARRRQQYAIMWD